MRVVERLPLSDNVLVGSLRSFVTKKGQKMQYTVETIQIENEYILASGPMVRMKNSAGKVVYHDKQASDVSSVWQ